MKFLLLLLAVTSVVHSKVLTVPDNHSAYGFLENSIGEAKRLQELESSLLESEQRIVGGVPAALTQYPFQAGLLIEIIGFEGYAICGASLVSANRLITAAHCWNDGVHQAWRITVVLGSITLFHGGTRIQTSVVGNHPNWLPLLARNDVGVVFLAQNVEFSNSISPISLPSGSELLEDFAGSQVIASGFGLTQDGGSISVNQFLSHVSLTVITNSQCRLGFPLVLQDSNICTRGVGGVGPCRGDSGGPLILTRNNRRILIGVTSFGHLLGCQVNFPAGFARVTSFMDFFNLHI